MSDIVETVGTGVRVVGLSFSKFVSPFAGAISAIYFVKNPEGGPVCRCSTWDGETRRTRCSVGEAVRRSGVVYLESWPVREPLYIFGAGILRPGMGSRGKVVVNSWRACCV